MSLLSNVRTACVCDVMAQCVQSLTLCSPYLAVWFLCAGWQLCAAGVCFNSNVPHLTRIDFTVRDKHLSILLNAVIVDYRWIKIIKFDENTAFLS